MQDSQSRLITLVAVAQFIPLVLFPWDLSLGSVVAIVILLALSVFLGWTLLTRRAWGITLTIFVQGYNIIVRIITFWSNVYSETTGLDIALLVTYVLSVTISWVLLTRIDRPEVRLLFES